MNFKATMEFQKDFKRLSKKFKSLDSDLLEFKKVLSESPLGNGKHFNILTKNDEKIVIKARLFCKYLKGSSLRIIYGYIQRLEMIELIEIYSKNERADEDRGRIDSYLAS